MAQFQADDDVIDDERRAQAGAEAEEEHSAALVSAQRLHGGVVDDAHRLAEAGLQVEAEPAGAEVDRLLGDLAADDRRREAHGNGVVGPVGGVGGTPSIIRCGVMAGPSRICAPRPVPTTRV